MGTEIERKYLVEPVAWQSHKAKLQQQDPNLGQKYCQGYLPTSNETTVRVRIIGDRAYLTIKSKSQGYKRAEYEYPIPLADGESMLADLCSQPLIEKIRYKIPDGNLVWEVDEFLGANAGLIIAEVELTDEQQQIEPPHWIEREVTDPKYYNSNLIKHPYSQWRTMES